MEEIKEIAAYRYPINLRSIDKTMDIKITISDDEELNRVLNNIMKMYTRSFVYSGSVNYRIICFKGEAGVILKKDSGYKVIEVSGKNLEVLEIIEVLERLKNFCKEVYKQIPIEFMYIDVQEEEELKVVDLGCVFDIGSELSDVKDKVIEFFIESIKKLGIGLIPLIAVTGTNGKTTTTRLIYNILKGIGFNTAMTSTGGIFINHKKIKEGDTTGFLSAREVLSNQEVEVAVMETARGGIYRNGLGYEKAKAVVFTSISEDHIGMENIKDIKDLLNIKSVLFEELDMGGKLIIKAQEEVAELVKEKNNVCLFGIDKNHLIESHIDLGREAFYQEDFYIVWCKNKIAKKILDIRNLSFAHNGYSKSNILNVMASLAAVFELCNDTEKILKVLGSIKCDLYTNPGRQNILDFENFKVILDYGHNAEAFHEVLSIAKSLKPSKLTSIIAAAGDRMDKYIKELGSVAAQYSDYIIVREQDNLRGRRAGESAGLIRDGILQEGFSEDKIIIITKEEDAIIEAMEKAEENEVIVLFTQCLDVIMPVINGYLKKRGKPPVGEELDFGH
jgi:UDP-N-acetylmuramyl tripeptide synthase